MRFLMAILVGLLCLTSLGLPSTSKAAIRPVPYTYETIQEAVDSSAVGDTIQITDAATYSDFITDKELLIESTGESPATVTGSILCQTKGTLRRLNLRNTAYSGGTGVIRFAPTNYDDTLRVEACELKGLAGQIASTGISLDTGPVIMKDCVMDSLLHVSFGLTYQAGAGVLRLENCLIKTRHGMGIGAGLNELVGSTMVCAYDTVGTEVAFVVTVPWSGINCKVIRSIVEGFDTVFSSCPSESVAYNVFNDYTSLGCGSVDPDSNLIGVDPLFCDEHESPVGKYTFRIDTPAIAVNNSFGVDIGKQLGVECAWGTLARNTTVGDVTVQVLEDVTVPSGLNLTLDAGALLRFDDDDNSASGSDTTLNELIINGVLEVSGSSSDTVRFVSAKTTPAEGDWYGIDVRSGGSASIDHAVIQHATYGARVRTNESSAITHSRFASNENYDILAGAGGGSSFPLRLAHNTITVGGGTGIDFQSVVDGAVVDTNTVVGNSSSTSGVKMDFYTYGSDVTLTGNTVSGFSNGAGVWEFAAASLTMIKNSVSDSKWGVQVTNGSPAIGTTSSESDNYITDNVVGVYVNKGAGGTATPVIRNNHITSNTFGVEARNGAQPDLGTGTNARGNNTMTGNTTYCIWNRNAGGNPQIPAQYNYFGECDQGIPFCAFGNVDVDNQLCTAPASAAHVQMVETPLPPKGLRITGVSPNPMLSGGEIHLSLEQGRTQVKLDLFDVTGRLVRSFGEFEVGPGQHPLHWDGLNEQGVPVRSGIYFVRGRSTEGQQAGARILVAR